MRCYILLYLSVHAFLSSCFGQGTDAFWNTWNDESKADTIRLQALKDVLIQEKYYLTHYDSSFLITDLMLDLGKSKGLQYWQADAYHLKGLTSYYHDKIEEAIAYYKRSLDLKVVLGRKRGIAQTSNNIAVAYKLLRDYPKALEYNFRALEVRKEIQDEKGIAASLQNISTIYYNEQQYEEALSYALEGYEFSERAESKPRMAKNALSAGNAYSELEQYEEALRYFILAQDLYKELRNQKDQATCLDNMGNVYFKQEKFGRAREYHQEALEIRQSIQDRRGLTLSYINLGKTYFELKNYSLSLDLCSKGLEYAQSLKDQLWESAACECLSGAHEGLGNLEQALNYFQLHSSLQDSLQAIEKAKELEEIESKYQLKEKEALLAQQELELSEERYARTLTLAIALFALVTLIAMFALFRNRLQRKRQEAELVAELERAESDKLRELDQLKSNFFANISHEFRTPLTLIMSPLEQMLDGKLSGDALKYQRIMHRNGKRLQSLINQLLDLSKLESGHLQLNNSEGKLSQFLRATALSFSSLADRKQIQYQVLGPDKDVMASFDKDVLEKILMNLISNAFKFTPEEGRILLAFEVEGIDLNIIVEDSGIGIPESSLPSIFDRFYSTSAHSDLQMSSGIGLALTKELVELLKGEITVTSKEGQGTQFCVKLPIHQIYAEGLANEQTDPISKLPLEPSDAFIPMGESLTTDGKPVLLIVEDNEDVRNYLAEQLLANYQVEQAINGKVGWDMARTIQPQLIISDVMMPEMDGNELCKMLKTDPLTSHIPVILLTAKADRQDKLQGLETGADAYLTKPFDHHELQLRIRNLIEQRTQLREKFSSDFRFAPSELTVNSLDAEFLERIRSLIEANMEDETFSVVELSKEIGMSRSNLFRKLKALTNQSPNQVIREMRLIRARDLLEKGAGTSAEVGFMVGFNSASYFSKCFRDFYGVSPSEV